MSYKRNYKKASYKKKPKYRNSGFSLAKQNAKKIAYLKQSVKEEFKYIDDEETNTEPDTAGDVVLLTGVAAGTNSEGRIGDSFRLKSIEMDFSIAADDSASATIARCLIVLDTNNRRDGVANPLINDVLESVNINSHRNKDFRKRFIILKD